MLEHPIQVLEPFARPEQLDRGVARFAASTASSASASPRIGWGGAPVVVGGRRGVEAARVARLRRRSRGARSRRGGLRRRSSGAAPRHAGAGGPAATSRAMPTAACSALVDTPEQCRPRLRVGLVDPAFGGQRVERLERTVTRRRGLQRRRRAPGRRLPPSTPSTARPRWRASVSSRSANVSRTTPSAPRGHSANATIRLIAGADRDVLHPHEAGAPSLGDHQVEQHDHQHREARLADHEVDGRGRVGREERQHRERDPQPGGVAADHA